MDSISTSEEFQTDPSPKPHWRRKSFWVIGALALFVLWFVPPVYKLKFSSVTVTRWKPKAASYEAKVGPGQPGWTSAKKISKHGLYAIIAAEDGRFYEHHGFDIEAIQKSIEYNRKRKSYARGASTISQQVVKMAFLSREKTLIRKAREAIGTVLMELLLSKEEILEWYINLAEFGDGVYSVADGSRYWFHTKPELLSIEQAVHLALVLPSPNKWSAGLRKKALSSFGHKRFAAILNNMRMSGHITKAQWAAAVTRGDFGRPIQGYAALLAADEKASPLCPGSPDCPGGDEEEDDGAEGEELRFPPEAAPSPAPVGSAPSAVPGAASPGAAGAASPGIAAPVTAPVAAPAAAPPPPPATPPSLPPLPEAEPGDDDGEDFN